MSLMEAKHFIHCGMRVDGREAYTAKDVLKSSMREGMVESEA